MSFTDNGEFSINLSSVFNIVTMDKSLRGNIYFTLNELPLLFIFYNRKQKVLRLAFWVVLSKFLYNLGILLTLFPYDKGYSDYLNVIIVGFFLFFDVYNPKWKFQLRQYLESLSRFLHLSQP